MKINITTIEGFKYNFTCRHCYIDLKNHTFNIPGYFGLDPIGFETLKRVEITNVEEIKNEKEKCNS